MQSVSQYAGVVMVVAVMAVAVAVVVVVVVVAVGLEQTAVRVLIEMERGSSALKILQNSKSLEATR